MTDREFCKSCRHSFRCYEKNNNKYLIGCSFYCNTGIRRGCKPGVGCNRYEEPSGRKYRYICFSDMWRANPMLYSQFLATDAYHGKQYFDDKEKRGSYYGEDY